MLAGEPPKWRCHGWRYGNMTCQTNGQTQGPCPNYSFSASTNRITTSGFTYDAAGDLTNDGTRQMHPP